jgi:hypothetical protein
MAALSPSGDHLAMIGVSNGTRQIIVIDKNTKPVLSLPVGDAKIREIFWAGDLAVLIHKTNSFSLGLDFSADKAELSAMVVIPLNGARKPWQIFQGKSNITGGVNGFHGIVERAGKYYGYFGGATFDGTDSKSPAYLLSTRPVLYEVDLEDGRIRKIADRAPAPENWRDWLIGGDGTVAATIDHLGGSGRWFIRNHAGKRIAEGVDPYGSIAIVGFGTMPDTLIYSHNDSSENRVGHWYEVPLGGGAPREILADVGIAGSYFDSRTRALAGYRVEGDLPTYHFFGARQQKIMAATLKAFSDLSVHLMDWNDSFDRLVVMTEGTNDPQT